MHGIKSQNEKSMPIVSVVIPTFNRGHVIEKAVKSILGQSLQSFEIIIIDDGSTDDTARIVSEISKNEPRIIFLKHDTNKGAQVARNRGIKAARGVWIAFLDSDDEFLPESLAIRLKIARDNDVDVVHSECLVLRDNNEKKFYGVPPIAGNVYLEVLRRPGPVFPALLVKKKAIRKIGWLDEHILSYQEWDTAIRLAKHYRFGFSSEATFIYDCRGTDTLSRDMLRDARGYEQIFSKHRMMIWKHLGLQALAHHYEFAASRYCLAGNQKETLRCQKMARYLLTFSSSRFLKSVTRIKKKFVK